MNPRGILIPTLSIEWYLIDPSLMKECFNTPFKDDQEVVIGIFMAGNSGILICHNSQGWIDPSFIVYSYQRGKEYLEDPTEECGTPTFVMEITKKSLCKFLFRNPAVYKISVNQYGTEVNWFSESLLSRGIVSKETWEDLQKSLQGAPAPS